jgi:gluconolactonase
MVTVDPVADHTTSTMRPIADGLQFPEGPIVMGDGSVVLVEIRRGTLTRVTPDGQVSVVAELGGGPNGAAIGPDGAVYVCNNGGFQWHDVDGIAIPGHEPDNYIGGRIQRVTLDGTVTDLYTECDGRALRGPNDIVFDSAGGFWFTDLGKTRPDGGDVGVLYYALADGSSITEVAQPLTQPNGVGLSPDGSRVYVAETGPGRVWYWDVPEPGHAQPGPTMFGSGGGTLLHGFAGYQLLDSMAVDGDGNVCVATLITGAVSMIAPDGTLLRQIHVPEPDPLVTNICFAGAGSHTAYVTSSGRGILYRADWPTAGIDLAFTA